MEIDNVIVLEDLVSISALTVLSILTETKRSIVPSFGKMLARTKIPDLISIDFSVGSALII